MTTAPTKGLRIWPSTHRALKILGARYGLTLAALVDLLSQADAWLEERKGK